jgi:LemA protein
MAFIWGIIVFLFWVAVIIGVFAIFAYNKLARLSQKVQKARSNIEAAAAQFQEEVSQLKDIVEHHNQADRLTYAVANQSAVGADGSPVASYQQAGAMLASIQGFAQRFPDLKNDSSYVNLEASVAKTQTMVHSARREYADAADEYNSARGTIPTVLIAGFIGFPKAPYFDFDLADKAPSKLRDFKTDDGERLKELLGTAGSRLAGVSKKLVEQAGQAGRVLADQAGHAGKMIAEKVQERQERKATQYFYMMPGAVPKGPASMDDIQRLLTQGTIDSKVMIAEAGSDNWQPLASVNTVNTVPTKSMS